MLLRDRLEIGTWLITTITLLEHIGSLWKEERGERVAGSLGAVVDPMRRLLVANYCIRLNGDCCVQERDKIEIVGESQDSLSGALFGVRAIAVLGAAAGFNLNRWGQHHHHINIYAFVPHSRGNMQYFPLLYIAHSLTAS